MDTTLTTRQQAVLAYIRNHIEQRGVAPTVREIGEAFGIGSTNGVMCHLNALEKKGYIERGRGTARHIRIVGEPSREEVVQALRDLWEWQRGIVELVPEELSCRIGRILGEKGAAK